jgi:3-hydroxybutyryl-CoA dehydrogenase
MDFPIVGVVGAGTMGTGVALSLALTQHHVVLVDVSEQLLTKAHLEIDNALRIATLFGQGLPRSSSATVFQRIEETTDYTKLGRAQFVIENATEHWDVKKEVYKTLDLVTNPETFLSANTSATSITKLGSLLKQPNRLVGMHFMNPPAIMPVVELVRGYHTSSDTLRAAEALIKEMGKESIVVNDSPGFVTNRVMMLMINEAILLAEERVASVADIDRLFKTCFGHKMGPLETADLIGLDTVLLSLEVILRDFNDDKYRPSLLLQRLVSAGLLGRKSGHGFYEYSEEKGSRAKRPEENL